MNTKTVNEKSNIVLIQYLQHPWEQLPTCLHRVDGEFYATCMWERGWLRANGEQEANIVKRVLAAQMMQPGDMARGYTQEAGWQSGRFIERKDGLFYFRGEDGTVYSTDSAEPNTFGKYVPISAKVDGEWVDAVYFETDGDQHKVYLDEKHGRKWLTVSEVTFRADARAPYRPDRRKAA